MTSEGTPGLGRRLLAILYDALLLAGLLVAAALPWTLLAGTADGAGGPIAWRAAFQAYLVLVAFGFFGWFWTHGGQTLGMRAWRLRLVDASSGGKVGWRQATLRFVGAWVSAALLGLGYASALTDRERRTWHDRLSGTRLILLPKSASQPTRRNM